MSKNALQIAALVQLVMRASKGKLSSKVAIALAVGVVLYALLLQPYIEKKYGVTLPGVPTSGEATGDETSGGTKTGADTADGDRHGAGLPTAAPTVDPSELKGLLTDIGRGAYRSPAGLRYTRGSQQGHRLAHVMVHAHDVPDRVGQHGVFGDDDPAAVVRLVDEAYTQAQSGSQSGRGVRTEREGDRTTYTVDLGRRIGYIGGQSGNRRNRPSAEHVRLVVEGDRLITAYPVRP